MSRPITIIPSGNASISNTTAKFGNTSAYFDGTGDRLVTNDPTLALGTGNFTAEFWFNPINGGRTDAVGFNRIWQIGPNSENGSVYIMAEGTTNPLQLAVYIYTGGSYQRIILSSTTAANNTWHHVALTRSSGAYTLWLNGVSVGTNSSYTSFSQTFTSMILGGTNQTTVESYYGYLDEVRLSNNVRYTGSFTPSSTPFTNDANTLFLCHCEGTNSSNVFLDDNGSRFQEGVSAVGSLVSTTQKQFGSASMYFDGVNDYVTSTSSTNFGFGTGDFTMEAWVYRLDSRFQVILNARDLSVYANVLVITATNLLGWSNGSVIVESTGTVPLATWSHVAVSRSSGTLRMFLNGTQVYSGTQSLNVGTVARPVLVGAFNDLNGPFYGYIDEVRVSNTARYTAGFTPATSAFTNDSNTRLLIHANGENNSTALVDDNGSTAVIPTTQPRRAKDIIAIGAAQVSTAQSKFGGASYLGSNSTVDRLEVSHFGDLAFGTSDFTIECWFRVTTTAPQYQCLYDSREQNDLGHTFEINYSTLKFVRGYNAVITHGTAISTNTWYHVAVSRSGTTLRMFVNGVLSGSVTNSDSFTSVNPFKIGTSFNLDAGTIGNIDEFRISNIARYTSDFTPATSAFNNDANTLLLIHADGTNGSTLFVDDVSGGVIEIGAASLTITSSLSVTGTKFEGTTIHLGSYIQDDYIQDDYFYDNKVRFGLSAELTEKQGVTVEASGLFSAAFSETASVQRNRFGASTQASAFTQSAAGNRTRSTSTAQASQFNIFALGSRSTDIDLVAFNQASLAVSGNRIRFADSAQISQFNIQIAVGGVQPASASLSSSFSQTAAVAKVMSFESAMTFDFTPSVTVNAVRVVAMLAEIMSALNNDPSRFRDIDVTLENILNLSSQSDRIRDYASQQQSQADLSATANQTRQLSSSLTTQSSLFAIISHIEGADMIAFGSSTLSLTPSVSKDTASQVTAQFTQTASSIKVLQASASISSAFAVNATVSRPSRYVGIPTITSGNNKGTLTFDSATKKFVSSIRYDAFEGWGSPGTNIVWTGAEFVMVQFQNKITYKSSDGINWTKFTNNLPSLEGSTSPRLFYTNSKFHMFHGASTGTQRWLPVESSDGINWSSYTTTGVGLTGLTGNHRATSLIYNSNRHYLTTSIYRDATDVRGAGNISNSGSYTTYTAYTAVSGSPTYRTYMTDGIVTNFWYITVSRGEVVSTGVDYQGQILGVSRTGGTSTAVTPTGQTGFRALAYNSASNILIVVGNGGKIYRNISSENTTLSNYLNSFSSITSPTTNDLLSVSFDNGQFMAVGKGGTVLTSTTGASGTWTQRITGVTHDLFGRPKFIGNNTWVVEYGINYSDLNITTPLGILRSTDNGVTWTDYSFSTQYTSAKISYPDHPGYASWKTIDFWLQINQRTTGGNSFRIGQGTDWFVQINPNQTSGSESFLYANGASQVSSGTTYAPYNQLNHYRIVYDGTRISLYVNGTRLGTSVVSNLNFASANTLDFAYTGQTQYYNTYLDEFVITDKLLTDPNLTSFSVPTQEYVNDYDTRLLLHFNNTYEDDASELSRLRIIDAQLTSAFTQSSIVNRFRDTSSTQNSQFTIAALGSRSTDIDLVAFGNASLSANFDNFRPFDSNLSSAFVQSSRIDGVKPFDSALTVSTTAEAIPTVTRDVTVDTDAIATQLTAAAKVGNTLVTIITNTTQTTTAVKNVAVDSQQYALTQFFVDPIKAVDGTFAANAEFSQYSDLRRFRDNDSAVSTQATQTTTAVKTTDVDSNMSGEFACEASPAGSRIGINAVLTATFNQTSSVEKLKITGATLSSEFTSAASGDRTRGVALAVDSAFTQSAIGLRIKQFDIETDVIASQLTAAAKVGNTLVTIITRATQTTTAVKSVEAIVNVDSAFTQTSNFARTRDTASNQSSDFTQTVQEDLFKAFDIQMSSTFTLAGNADVTATIALIAFADTALDVDAVRVRPGVVDLDSAFTETAAVKVTRTTSSTQSSNFTQQATLSGNFFGTSNQTAQFGITANTAVLHISQYVYKVPAENRVYKIVEETRFKAISEETRLYNIGRQ